MGRAEDRRMDPLLYDLFLHILEIHAENPALIPDKGTMDDAVAVVLQRGGEADIGRGVEENLVPL